MLVLTRRIGEEIVIGHNIRLAILLTKGEKVRLGITAPSHVPVDRLEVYERRGRRHVRSRMNTGAVTIRAAHHEQAPS